MSTVVMILAGGKGSRLGPLTCHRAKPAVPFGGRYRIVDFVLSNFVNSGYRRIYVLTQYMASSLIKHLNRNWHLSGIGEFVEEVPAQMRTGGHWYLGTADAVYQNLNLVRDARPEHVCVFGGDHIYKFDVSQMERSHREKDADLTIAVFPVPTAEASAFGVMQVDEEGRVLAFQEKPDKPAEIPGRPGWSLVSMGNYIFRARELVEALLDDAGDPESAHDFGKNIIPLMLAEGKDIRTYDFAQNNIFGEPEGATPYWRDVGTIESYFQANMELRSPLPTVNLYNRQWRVRTAQRDYPPARFVSHQGGSRVALHDSLVCEGAIVQSASIDEVVLGYDCFVHAGADVKTAVFMAGCDIGENCRLTRVLADKNCRFDPNVVIGEDIEADRARFPFVTKSGIVVLPKGTHVPAEGKVEFAYDMAMLLEVDPATRDSMARLAGEYSVSNRDRHSYRSMGPRYRDVAKSMARSWQEGMSVPWDDEDN